MKKAVSILLFTFYIFSTTEFVQLLKLPMLLEHYAAHKSENNSLTFFAFLSLHYSLSGSDLATDKEHEHLPFKTHDSSCCTSFVAFLPNQQIELVLKPVFFVSKKLPVFIPNFNGANPLANIWQPPKSC